MGIPIFGGVDAQCQTVTIGLDPGRRGSAPAPPSAKRSVAEGTTNRCIMEVAWTVRGALWEGINRA